MKQIDELRERKMFNDYAIAQKGDKICVSFSRNGGRSCLPPWWAVWHIEKNFKNTAWYQNGAEIFSCNTKSDKEPFYKALHFASRVTDCYEWIKTPFGGYVSIFTANKANLKYRKKSIIKVEKGK